MKIRPLRGRPCGIKKFTAQFTSRFPVKQKFFFIRFAHPPLISFRGFVYFSRPSDKFRTDLNVRISNTSVPPLCFDTLPTVKLLKEYHDP
jgi:hypothetical protein